MRAVAIDDVAREVQIALPISGIILSTIRPQVRDLASVEGMFL